MRELLRRLNSAFKDLISTFATHTVRHLERIAAKFYFIASYIRSEGPFIIVVGWGTGAAASAGS